MLKPISAQIDPTQSNLGVGLGLPGLKPGIGDKALLADVLVC